MELFEHFIKIIKQRRNDVRDLMANGAVDSMEKYKYMLGQAHAYQLIIQEISNLLKTDKEQDEEGNVIDIGDRNTKN